MQEKYNLRVDRYLTEDAEHITDRLLSHDKAVLLASMGTGKTTLLEKHIVPRAKTNGRWMVFVIPSVAQLQQMSLRGVEVVCNGSNCSGDRMFYGTTPDSLHKVMAKAYELGKTVWMAVDEAHAVVTSSAFRRKFLEIDKYAQDCEKVIRMTATMQPLEDWYGLGPIYQVERQQMVEVPTTIQRVKQINVDTIYEIVASKYQEGESLFTHYNNIEGNNVLAEKLSKLIKVKKEQVLVESFQENLFGDMPEYTEIDHTDQAVSLHAGNKDNTTTRALIEGKSLDKVAIASMTSFVKEGMNITNDRKTTVVIVWDKTLTYAELLQTIGRYRLQENIKEVVVIVQAYDKQDINYVPYETLLEATMDAATKSLEAIESLARVDKDTAKDFADRLFIAFNEHTQKYEVNVPLLRNWVYQKYSTKLRMAPIIIKKVMESEFAIKLKVTIAQDVFDPESTELMSQVFEIKRKKEEQFKQLKAKMLTYDDSTLEEVLEYSVNRNRPEMKEALECMELYQKLAPPKFKKALKDMINIGKMEKVKAFRELAATGPKDYQEVLNERYARVINATIKDIGINEAERQFKYCKRDEVTELASRQVLIRKFFAEQEKKQGRIGKKMKKELAEQLLQQGYYKLRSTNKKILQEEDKDKKKKLIEKLHKKNLAKAQEKLEQDIQYIYNTKKDSKGSLISSIKY